MDLDAYYSKKEESHKTKEKKKQTKRKGGPEYRFTKEEVQFVKENYDIMTDEQIAKRLGRSRDGIENFRKRNGLTKFQGRRSKPDRIDKLATLKESEKRKFFLAELKNSSMYKALVSALEGNADSDKYIKIYENDYIEFMLDPTIETMTHPERQLWNEMTIAKIRILMFIKKESEPNVIEKNGELVSISSDYSKEIKDCQDMILKCQKELNITRAQRLKQGSDQAINFTQLIKELRSPEIRRKVGDQAAMLRYITLRHYNDHLGKNIISGDSRKFDIGELFKEGKEPEYLDGDFTGQKIIAKQRAEKQGLKAETKRE